MELGRILVLPVYMIGGAKLMTGKVVYINKEHRFFMAEFVGKMGIIKECYKF